MSSSANGITPQLLEALISPNTGIRAQAETVFQSMTVVDRVQGLLQQLLVSTTTNVDNDCNHPLPLLTAVLLRRDILKLDQVPMLQELVSRLWNIFSSFSQRGRLAMMVGHCLAEVCASLSVLDPSVSDTVLHQLVSQLEPWIQREQPDVASLKLFSALADRSPVAFHRAVPTLALPTTAFSTPELLEAWIQLIVNVAIASTITTATDASVSLVRTTPSLDKLTVEPNSAAAELGSNALVPLLSMLMSCNDESAILSSLQHLSNAAVTCPSLLVGKEQVLQALVQTCLQIAQQQLQQDRHVLVLNALQVLSSLVSVGAVKHQCISESVASLMATTALPILIHTMCNAEGDEEDWASEPASLVQDAMDSDEEDFLFAESLVESFLANLRGALNIALPCMQQLLESSNWKSQRAGLTLLECGLAATPIALTPHLPIVVQAATSLTMSHPRVHYHSLRVLGTLCETHPSIRASHGAAILQGFAKAFGSPITKISAMASLGLVSYLRAGEGENSDETLHSSYLEDLLRALVQGPLSLEGTDSGSVTVRVRAMGATACLAQSYGEAFCPYYGDIMGGLLNTAQLSVVELAGAAVEAATIVGQAVGREYFERDAMRLLEWILPALQQQADASSSSSSILEALLSACARIASVLKADFAPYVDSVLPLLLRRVQEPPDVSIMEGDEAGLEEDFSDIDDGTKSMTVAVPGRGFTKVTINTTKIQEKSQAIRALYEHAKAMGASFGPYGQTCLEVLLPLINFPYSTDVRGTSGQTVSAIFEAACSYGEDVAMTLPQHYLPLLAQALAKQVAQEETSDMEALYALADSLSEIYYTVYRYRKTHIQELLGKFTLQHAQQSVEGCMKAMVACLERRADLNRALSGALTGEDEKEEYRAMLRAEEQLLTPLVDSVGYTLKFFQQSFLPLFEQYVVPVLGPSLSNPLDVRARVSAVCLYDDVVEHCGTEAAAKYATQLMQGVMMAMENPSEKDLLQAAVYGIAQMARHAPSSVFSGHLPTIVHRLLLLTSVSKEEAVEDAYLIEIATSALASLALFGPFTDLKFVDRETLMNAFVSNLPIQQDDDEAQICHAGFCGLIETGSIDLGKEAFRVTRIIGEILSDVEGGDEIATPDTVERLSVILYQMQQNVPASTMQQAFDSLDSQCQQTVSSVIQQVTLSRSKVVTP